MNAATRMPATLLGAALRLGRNQLCVSTTPPSGSSRRSDRAPANSGLTRYIHFRCEWAFRICAKLGPTPSLSIYQLTTWPLSQRADDFSGSRLEFRQVLSRECLHRMRWPQPKHVYGANDATAVAQRDRDRQQAIRMRRSAIVSANMRCIPGAVTTRASFRKDRVQARWFARQTVFRFRRATQKVKNSLPLFARTKGEISPPDRGIQPVHG